MRKAYITFRETAPKSAAHLRNTFIGPNCFGKRTKWALKHTTHGATLLTRLKDLKATGPPCCQAGQPLALTQLQLWDR